MLASTDVIDRQEVKDLVPFNHLRNSRADSGMNYWTNSGFEVDAENGVSGTASFKQRRFGYDKKPDTDGLPGQPPELYLFSADCSEDLQKGPSGQVGIEVTFEYEDGPRRRGSSTSFNIGGNGLCFFFANCHRPVPQGVREAAFHHHPACITDCTGKVYFTDIMVQGGSIATGWVGHPSEIQWTLDG